MAYETLEEIEWKMKIIIEIVRIMLNINLHYFVNKFTTSLTHAGSDRLCNHHSGRRSISTGNIWHHGSIHNP